MKSLIRSILPQWVINYFWHLPKAILANILYGFPSLSLKVIGITGTDGKTTTTNMVYQLLRDAGKSVSMISTIDSPGFHVTSPDPFIIQKFAKDAKDKGDEYLVLEVTSHALDQFRFWGIKFDIGVITNITHEHLDYHQTFESYKNAKLKLLKNVKFAVLNNNISYVRRNVITFGIRQGDVNQEKFKLKLKIPGDYNIENALATLAVSSVLGIDQGRAKKSIENFNNLSGRMEEVKNSKGIKIFIDFAHTPNGLKQSLKSLRSHLKSGRLISLIGCEGFRDEQKRVMMGGISGKLGDYTIITSVDPRGQLETINKQIITGAKKAGAIVDQNLFVIDDREKAIAFAINKLSKKGDVVGIFGKGHESSMNLDGKAEIPWSDLAIVQKILNG